MIRRFLWLLAAVYMIGISCQAIRAAAADLLFIQNTLTSLSKSVAIDPGNADYHELRAEHMEGLGLNPNAELKEAVALSPLDSRFRIRLAFRAEADGDYSAAEEQLMQAAAVDRKFGPRWALMNFYFRRGLATQFWFWTRRAFEMSYGDRTSIFRLAWEQSHDELAIEKVLPADRAIRADYLAFLTANSLLDQADGLARQLARNAAPQDVNVLLDYCERAIETNTQSAVAVWNTLCRRKLTAFSALDPAGGAIVTNGNFATEPIRRAFDWRFPSVQGVSTTLAPDSRHVEIEMSGREPEDCVLMVQSIPIIQGSRYRMNWEYRVSEPEATSSAGASISGVTWEVVGPPPAYELLGRSPEMSERGDWKSQHLVFSSGAHSSANLWLHYKRPLASMRAEGALSIRGVTGAPIR